MKNAGQRLKKMKIEKYLTPEQEEIFVVSGTVVNTSEGDEYLNYPFWLKRTGKLGFFEVLKYDQLPPDVLDLINEVSWKEYSEKLQRQIDALKGEYAKQGEDVKKYGDLNVHLKLKLVGQQNDLLYRFCQFLHKHGYIDSDWYAEPPSPIDEFMASNPDVTQVSNDTKSVKKPNNENNNGHDIH